MALRHQRSHCRGTTFIDCLRRIRGRLLANIWDTGGTDRIDTRAKSRQIDLRNATLDLSEAAGGYVSRVDGVDGGFTIT